MLETRPMKILLLGGSGFIGIHLASRLARDQHQVTVLSRRAVGPLGGVGYVTGNAVTGQGLAEAASGQDAVVYLVGIIRETRGQSFHQAHVEGVANTVAAMNSSGVTRLIHMSALGARPGTGSRYFETKAEAEELVRSSKLDWTIFRPSLVFGPGDNFFGTVLKGLVKAPAPFIPQIGDGSFPFRPIWVGDAAEAFAQSLTNPETIGQAYNLVGPREYTFRELLLLVRNTLGLHKPLLPVPLVLMDLLVPVMNLLPFSPITLDQYQMLKAGNTAEPDAMLKTFRLEWRGLEAELPAILKFRPINL